MEALDEAVKNYIGKENTQYALMISGNWGIGKTFYWKNIIEKNVIPKINKKREKEGVYKTLYISLYGVGSFDEINNKILFSRMPKILSKKAFKLITILGTKFISGISNFFSVGNIEVSSKEINEMLSLKNHIMVFDDLERIDDIDTFKKALGIINHFAEHRNQKIIIITNQDKIIENFYSNTKEDWRKLKEKTVNEEIIFLPDYNYIIEQLAISYKKEKTDLSDYLQNNLETIKHAFFNSNSGNLRSLIFSLDKFKLLYEKIKELSIEIKEKEEILRRILYNIMTYSFEYKSGEIDKYEHKHIHEFSMNEYYNLKMMASLREKKENKNETLKEKTKDEKAWDFLIAYGKKYYENYDVVPIKGFFLLNFITAGYFTNDDFKIFINNLQAKNIIVETESFKKYEKLLRFEEIINSQGELEELVNDVLEEAKNGNYHQMYYPAILDILKFLIENKLCDKDYDEVVKDLENGMEKANEKRETSTYIPMIEQHIGGLKNELTKNVYERNIKNLEKNQKTFAYGIFDLLKQNKYDEFNQNLYSEDIRVSIFPIFVYIDIDEFFQILINFEIKEVRSFYEAFYKRTLNYKRDDQVFQMEIKSLKELQEKLENYIENVTRLDLRIWQLKRILKLLQELKNE